MKSRLLVYILMMFSFAAISQEVASPCMVYMKAKQNTELLQQPELFLSKRSLARRARQAITVSNSDLPIEAHRLQTVSHVVSKIGNSSRWLNAVYVTATPTEILDLLDLSFVESVQPVAGGMAATRIVELPLNYGYSNDQVAQINLDQGPHRSGFLGEDKLIAVLDAGFVGANTVTISDDLDVSGTRNFVEGGQNVYQGSSHGFSVLSTMAASMDGTYIGTAPSASYLLIKTEDELSETPEEMINWIAGAEYADSMGVDIINSSLGYSEFDDPLDNYTIADLDGRTSIISLGAIAAARTGILVVTSAGNAGGGPWNKITFPADADSILTVGSVSQFGQASSFSSRGYTADGRVKPNICARGEGAVVYRPDGTIAYANGTSFSSPIMAGASACLWQSVPNATAQQVIRALEVSSSHFYSRNEKIGHGIPNLAFAQAYLESLVNGVVLETIIYPNPFPDYLEFFFPDGEALNVELELRDLYGRTVVSDLLISKRYQAIWAPGDIIPAGTYFLFFKRGNESNVRRVIKLQ
ncbi:MAG: S8 family peptidase [Flavobacteriales bacterium]